MEGIERIVGGHGVVGSRGNVHAQIDEVAPDVGSRQALRPHSGFREVHVLGGVERLHGGDDVQLFQPGYVLGDEHLGVLEGHAGIFAAGAGSFHGPLEGVDGHVVGAVSDAVDPEVEAHGEELSAQLRQLVFGPPGLTEIVRDSRCIPP